MRLWGQDKSGDALFQSLCACHEARGLRRNLDEFLRTLGAPPHLFESQARQGDGALADPGASPSTALFPALSVYLSRPICVWDFRSESDLPHCTHEVRACLNTCCPGRIYSRGVEMSLDHTSTDHLPAWLTPEWFHTTFNIVVQRTAEGFVARAGSVLAPGNTVQNRASVLHVTSRVHQWIRTPKVRKVLLLYRYALHVGDRTLTAEDIFARMLAVAAFELTGVPAAAGTPAAQWTAQFLALQEWWRMNKKTVRGPWEGETLSRKYRNWSDVYRCRLLLVAHEALGYPKRTDGPQCYFAKFKELQASTRTPRRHGALGDGGTPGGGHGDGGHGEGHGDGGHGDGHGDGGHGDGGHGDGGHGGGGHGGGDHGEGEDRDDVSLSDASETSLEPPWEPPAYFPDPKKRMDVPS